MKRPLQTFVADFETTVYDDQEHTEVWASAIVELYRENVLIHHSISETFDYLSSLASDNVVYYHNLKFDGSFWLNYLLSELHFKQALTTPEVDTTNTRFVEDEDMENNTFKYIISSMGQWYTITIKVNNKYIMIKDSLKLLPFSVKRIGKAFKTQHQKLEMEYKGYRYSGCEITDEEKEYIKNDVLVMKEALEIMFNQGHTSLTIGSCCLKEYKKGYDKKDYAQLFPDLSVIKLDEDVYGSSNADRYIRRSYKGGWCYLVKGKENQIKNWGTTADVNSLYPSMMHSESGNYYPVGKPCFWKGNFIPESATKQGRYFFIRIRTRFYLKPNKLPFIQIKGNLHYKSTECLVTSDVWNKHDQKYCKKYIDVDGNITDALVTLTLTQTDFKLLQDHYFLEDFTILDGCWFYTLKGIFDEYIDHWKEIKINSVGAMRELAKLFLNNLYGKLASSSNSDFKIAYIKDNGGLGFIEVKSEDKDVGYIACGSAITSYARNFTIRAAQKNFYGVHERGFIYADTDSIHCDLTSDEIKGITVHDKNFCCWKLESTWDKAIFVRQKTYMEHVVEENLIPLEDEDEYWNVKCAGMPQKCKDLFLLSMSGRSEEEWEEDYPELWNSFDEEQKDFVLNKRDIEDFKIGLNVPGKLLPVQIKGGVILRQTSYEMR